MKKIFAFLINWGILIPIAAVVVSFALSNRQPVSIDLWPLNMSVEQPLYLIVLLAVLAGFLIVLVIMWISAGRARMRARREAFRATSLERELKDLKAAQGHSKGSSVPASGARTALPGSRDAA